MYKYNKPILPGRWLYTGLLGTSVDRSLDVVVDQSLAQGKLRFSSCPARPAGRGLILPCPLATIIIHQGYSYITVVKSSTISSCRCDLYELRDLFLRIGLEITRHNDKRVCLRDDVTQLISAASALALWV